MKIEDAKIGKIFTTATGKWSITDVGSRTVIAIKTNEEDPSWMNGPPYAIVETVFDENDLPVCHLVDTEKGECSKCPDFHKCIHADTGICRMSHE